MVKQGRAEVYRVRGGEGGYEIAFGLGTRHGIQTGACLTLSNERGEPMGTVAVCKVSETDSLATVGLDCTVKPGYIISLKG